MKSPKYAFLWKLNLVQFSWQSRFQKYWHPAQLLAELHLYSEACSFWFGDVWGFDYCIFKAKCFRFGGFDMVFFSKSFHAEQHSNKWKEKGKERRARTKYLEMSCFDIWKGVYTVLQRLFPAGLFWILREKQNAWRRKDALRSKIFAFTDDQTVF